MISRIVNSTFQLLLTALLFISGKALAGDVTIIDSRHYSNVFGEVRNFRIFLPPGYFENPAKRYPVIYFYHGWSQRYFGSGPDSYNSFEKGDDNGGDNIAAFVQGHDVIVVKPDGYNRSAREEYYLRPYNVLPVETYRQYPIYFPELVSFIDANYRTIPDRNHRAISGLSMGGFMSYWIGGKYPQLISAIGNFCGSAEFVVGPKDFPVEYRHIDLYRNYDGINVRLNYGNEDFIRYYHRDLNKIWLQVMDNYEYKIYPAAHSTCGMGEMFSFLLKTFDNPPPKPVKWYHADVYPEFSVWDYEVRSDRDVPGFTILENVDIRGFRCSVIDHMPDGELLPFVSLTVETAPLYEPDASYSISDFDLRTMKSSAYELKSDSKGRLMISLNGSRHEIGINKTQDKPNLSLSDFWIEPGNIARCGEDVKIRLTIVNKGKSRADGVKAVILPARKSAVVSKGDADFGNVEVSAQAVSKLPVVFKVNEDSIEIEKFKLVITDKAKNEWVEYFAVPLLNKTLPEFSDFEIADGRVVTVAKEGIHEETAELGQGNGDGIANPGESIVILVRENGKLWRTSLTCFNKFLNPYGSSIRISDNWGSYDHVGGSAKYSVPLIASDCPDGQVINAVAEYWLPDSPNHIIRKGLVNLKVTGRDNTPPQLRWCRVTGDNVIQARIFDGSAVKSVKAILVNKASPDKVLEYELMDDGKNGDRAQDDNVFSFRVPEQRFGMYTISLEAADLSGNRMSVTAPGVFVLH